MLVDITKTAVFNVTMTKCFFCIDFGVGSKNGSDDVYTEHQVGFGEFGGGASLTSEGIKLSAEGNMTSQLQPQQQQLQEERHRKQLPHGAGQVWHSLYNYQDNNWEILSSTAFFSSNDF